MNPWFHLGILLAIVAALVHAERGTCTGRDPGDLLRDVGLPALRAPGGGGPVLVFYVGGDEGVALVREAIAPERVVAEVEGGFAVREGRIVAVDREAVAAILTVTGWDERPLEFHAPAPRPPTYASRGPFDGAPARDGAPVMADLLDKPHLTRAEATAVLEQLR